MSSLNSQTYILLALLIFSFTVTPYIRKKVTNDFTNEEFFLYNNIFICIAIILYCAYLLKTNKCDLAVLKDKINSHNALLCIISAITGLAGGIILMMLLKENDVSFVIPQVQPVVIVLTMIISYFITKEDLNKFKLIGAGMIVFGLVVLNYGQNSIKKT